MLPGPWPQQQRGKRDWAEPSRACSRAAGRGGVSGLRDAKPCEAESTTANGCCWQSRAPLRRSGRGRGQRQRLSLREFASLPHRTVQCHCHRHASIQWPHRHVRLSDSMLFQCLPRCLLCQGGGCMRPPPPLRTFACAHPRPGAHGRQRASALVATACSGRVSLSRRDRWPTGCLNSNGINPGPPPGVWAGDEGRRGPSRPCQNIFRRAGTRVNVLPPGCCGNRRQAGRRQERHDGKSYRPSIWRGQRWWGREDCVSPRPSPGRSGCALAERNGGCGGLGSAFCGFVVFPRSGRGLGQLR